MSSPTSARLLATAATLFWRQGYAATGIRELAGALGIRTASLYHHMASKEDLLYAVCLDSLERINTSVADAIARPAPPLERLRNMLVAHLEAALADREKHATMLFEMRSLSTERRAEVQGRRDAYEAMLQAVLEQAQADGAISRQIPARYLRLALLNLLNWSIFWYAPGELTPSELGGVLSDIFLHGVAAAPEQAER